jgi:glycerophosphoryl diester phosphodiesterase
VTRPLAIAHRGDSARCPENTLPAFASALAAGADGCELDLRLLADGAAAICHDADLRRFGGARTPLLHMRANDLADTDVGSWFRKNPDRTFAGEPVPTLDALLADIARTGQWLLELKTAGGPNAATHTIALCKALVATLDRHRARARAYVLAFAAEPLAWLAEHAPDLRLVRNILRPPLRPARWLPAQPWLHAVDCDLRTLTPAFVAACHARGLRVFTYTCNHERGYLRARKLGVDAILSDRPDWLVRRLAADPA